MHIADTVIGIYLEEQHGGFDVLISTVGKKNVQKLRYIKKKKKSNMQYPQLSNFKKIAPKNLNVYIGCYTTKFSSNPSWHQC